MCFSVRGTSGLFNPLSLLRAPARGTSIIESSAPMCPCRAWQRFALRINAPAQIPPRSARPWPCIQLYTLMVAIFTSRNNSLHGHVTRVVPADTAMKGAR
jgi:hypothetical protein